jgi:hypothetical protein
MGDVPEGIAVDLYPDSGTLGVVRYFEVFAR